MKRTLLVLSVAAVGCISLFGCSGKESNADIAPSPQANAAPADPNAAAGGSQKPQVQVSPGLEPIPGGGTIQPGSKLNGR